MDQADIVVIGDSHVYGTSVPSNAKWSDRLQTLTGTIAYNMGFGGFAPYKNEQNFEAALSLNPKTILYGIYLGNDFYDDFDYFMRKGGTDPCGTDSSCRTALNRETRGPLAEEVGHLFRQSIVRARIEKGTILRSGFHALADHIKVLGFARALAIMFSKPASILDKDFDSAVEAVRPEQMSFICPVDEHGWKTIATPSYRARVLDYSDPRILFGFEQSKKALRRYARISKDRAIGFHVVILPTKEYVFFRRIGTDSNCGGYRQLVEREEHFRALLFGFLAGQGIPVIDVAQDLASASAQTYFENADGHPNGLGHEVIARKVAERITRQQADGGF